MPTKNADTENSNGSYICYSSDNEGIDAKYVDTTRILQHYNGIIKTLPKKNLIVSLNGSLLRTSTDLLEKLKSVNCCVLIVTSPSTIRTLISHANYQQSSLLNIFNGYASFTAFYELGGCEFGIADPRAWDTNLDTQAGWAAATIVKHHKRYGSDYVTLGFILSLADRYCPASCDPDGNRNWKRNVWYWFDKFQKGCEL